jgi:hypothetical protein
MKKQFKAPFDRNGNQITYTYLPHKSIDNYEFETTLTYKCWSGSRSGVEITWTDPEGKEFKSSMMLLDEVLNGSAPLKDLSMSDNLKISGKFTFKKQGTAILLTFVKS